MGWPHTLSSLSILRTNEEDTTQVQKDLSANLSKALLLGLAAANFFLQAKKVLLSSKEVSPACSHLINRLFAPFCILKDFSTYVLFVGRNV